MYFNWKRFLRDVWISFFPKRHPHLRIDGHRARVLVMFVFCMGWMAGSGRLGLLLDHILFPTFKRQRVRRPVFIIGNFRSGSTLLHRMLAASEPFTAMKTWELYFAPSISQRKFWRGFWIVDGWFGGLVRRTILSAQEKQLGSVTMHRVRLEEPEEDEAIFLYLWDSLFNWFFVPAEAEKNPYWRFDEAVPRWRRRRAMRFYHGVLKRHLWTAPRNAVYISKSPAFTARIHSLLEEFPDARVIELVRRPEEVVVSGAAWFSFAWHFFASPVAKVPFRDTFLEMVKRWYLVADALSTELPPEQYSMLRYEALVEDPERAVVTVVERMGIKVSDALRERLTALAKAKRKRRTHDYDLADIGVSREFLLGEFAEVYERLGYKE
ncbi:MAG: sulfotransferase family protein [Spirochaetales bacterium]